MAKRTVKAWGIVYSTGELSQHWDSLNAQWLPNLFSSRAQARRFAYRDVGRPTSCTITYDDGRKAKPRKKVKKKKTILSAEDNSRISRDFFKHSPRPIGHNIRAVKGF